MSRGTWERQSPPHQKTWNGCPGGGKWGPLGVLGRKRGCRLRMRTAVLESFSSITISLIIYLFLVSSNIEYLACILNILSQYLFITLLLLSWSSPNTVTWGRGRDWPPGRELVSPRPLPHGGQSFPVSGPLSLGTISKITSSSIDFAVPFQRVDHCASFLCFGKLPLGRNAEVLVFSLRRIAAVFKRTKVV